MKAGILLFISVLILPLAVGAAAVSSTDDAQRVQGSWEIVSYVENGNPVPKALVDKMSVTCKKNKITVVDAQGTHAIIFTLDPGSSPKHIALIPQDGPYIRQTLQGIYSLNDNTLKICVQRLADRPRPQTFTSPPGSQHFLLILKQSGKKPRLHQIKIITHTPQ